MSQFYVSNNSLAQIIIRSRWLQQNQLSRAFQEDYSPKNMHILQGVLIDYVFVIIYSYSLKKHCNKHFMMLWQIPKGGSSDKYPKVIVLNFQVKGLLESLLVRLTLTECKRIKEIIVMKIHSCYFLFDIFVFVIIYMLSLYLLKKKRNAGWTVSVYNLYICPIE